MLEPNVHQHLVDELALSIPHKVHRRRSKNVSQNGHGSAPTFGVCRQVANYSGLSYDLEHGTNITAASETVWTEILKSTSRCKTCGNLAFHTRMPTDNVALVGVPSQATTSRPPAGTSFDEANILDQEKALDDIEYSAGNPPDVDMTMPPPLPFDAAHRPTFTPSTPGTSTVASGKRKASGDSGDNMRTVARPPGSTKSASESGKSVKSQRVAIPQAFQDMSKEIHYLTSSFDRATDVMQERATQVASRPVVDPIPVCKQKAIIQLQKEGLEDHEIVEVIKHFQADVAIADSYLVIEKESTRKLFLSTYLK
ncbi:hypothetical protein DFH29DRAFT_994216 [Suillus ampliporus]|nr:hypothetical protein DFH29DRAFT_994216 [Suillus ampliporus]